MVQNAGLGVGALLRQRREELGLDADSVSRQLRIRATYIKSIEDGRLQDLPGTAYAVGFVRTYADFLGFDGNSVVATYRDELAQRGPNDPVTWRMEERESYFPGGKLLVACVVLAGAAYGVWYYLSNTQSGVGLIESVPEYLKKGTGTASDSAKPGDSAKTAADTGKPAEAPSESAPSGQSTETTPGSAPSELSGTAAAPSTTPPANAESQTGETAAPESQTAQPATPGQQPAPSATAGAGAGAAATGTAPPQATSGQATSETSGIQPNPAPQSAVSAPQADGGEAAPGVAAAAATTTTRIVIHAKLESWVQVLDKDNKPILSRVLRAGETYAVPDQAGLIMNTGNAGGIEMVLDGKPLQSLGSVGLVRRNIVLDPEKLASGAAFLKTPVPAPAPGGAGANSGD